MCIHESGGMLAKRYSALANARAYDECSLFAFSCPEKASYKLIACARVCVCVPATEILHNTLHLSNCCSFSQRKCPRTSRPPPEHPTQLLRLLAGLVRLPGPVRKGNKARANAQLPSLPAAAQRETRGERRERDAGKCCCRAARNFEVSVKEKGAGQLLGL